MFLLVLITEIWSLLHCLKTILAHLWKCWCTYGTICRPVLLSFLSYTIQCISPTNPPPQWLCESLSGIWKKFSISLHSACDRDLTTQWNIDWCHLQSPHQSVTIFSPVLPKNCTVYWVLSVLLYLSTVLVWVWSLNS